MRIVKGFIRVISCGLSLCFVTFIISAAIFDDMPYAFVTLGWLLGIILGLLMEVGEGGSCDS